MKLYILFIFVIHLVTSSGLTISSERYKTVFDVNTKSVKPNLATVMASTRVQCAQMCNGILGCGGFNVHTLSPRSLHCELKNGPSGSGDMQDIYNVTYYEKQVEIPKITARDCLDIQNSGVTTSGVYQVNLNPDGADPEVVDVYCDMDAENGGWLVLIKREDGSLNYDRNWTEYKNGFGNPSLEHWLGLESMYKITNNGRPYTLRVDITLFSGETYYAKYDTFYIDPESAAYKLHVSGYSGTAGDSLAYHNRLKFSTYDVDNDWESSYCCAERYSGGFWYKKCSVARLTGLYGEVVEDIVIGDVTYLQGIFWSTSLDDTHPKYIDMKIRP